MADDMANCVCASQISSTLVVKLFTVVRALRTWYAYNEMSKADSIGKVDKTNLANGQTLKSLAGVTKSGHNNSRSYITCTVNHDENIPVHCMWHALTFFSGKDTFGKIARKLGARDMLHRHHTLECRGEVHAHTSGQAFDFCHFDVDRRCNMGIKLWRRSLLARGECYIRPRLIWQYLAF